MTKRNIAQANGKQSTYKPYFYEKQKGIFKDESGRFQLTDMTGGMDFVITDLIKSIRVGKVKGLVAARQRVTQYLHQQGEQLSKAVGGPRIIKPTLVAVPSATPRDSTEAGTFCEKEKKTEVVHRSPVLSSLWSVATACKQVSDGEGFFQATQSQIVIASGESGRSVQRRLKWLLDTEYLVIIDRHGKDGLIYGWNKPYESLVVELLESSRVAGTRKPLPMPRRKYEEDTPEKVAAAMTGGGVVMAGRALAKINEIESRLDRIHESSTLETIALRSEVRQLRDEIGAVARWLRDVFQAPFAGGDE